MAESVPKAQESSLDDPEFSESSAVAKDSVEVPSETVPLNVATEDVPSTGTKGQEALSSIEPPKPGDFKEQLEKNMKTSKCFQLWETGLTDYVSSEDETDTYSEVDSVVKVSPDSGVDDPLSEQLRGAIHISSELISTVEIAETHFDDLEDDDVNPESEEEMHEDFKTMCTSLSQLIDEHLEDANKLVEPQTAYSPQDTEMATLTARFDPTTAKIHPSPKGGTEGTKFTSESVRFEPVASSSRQITSDRKLTESDFASTFGEPRANLTRSTSLGLVSRSTSLHLASAGLHPFPTASSSTSLTLDSRATSLPSVSAVTHMLADSHTTCLGHDSRVVDLPSTSAELHTSAVASYIASNVGDQSLERDPRAEEFVAAVNRFVPSKPAIRPTTLSLDTRTSDFSFMVAGIDTEDAECSPTVGGFYTRADESMGTRFEEMSKSRFDEHRYHTADRSQWSAKKKRTRKTPDREKRAAKEKSKETIDLPESSLKEKPKETIDVPESSLIEKPKETIDVPESSLKEKSEIHIEPSSSRSEPKSTEPELPKIRTLTFFKSFSKIYGRVPRAFERVSRALDSVPRRVSGALSRIHGRFKTPSEAATTASTSFLDSPIVHVSTDPDPEASISGLGTSELVSKFAKSKPETSSYDQGTLGACAAVPESADTYRPEFNFPRPTLSDLLTPDYDPFHTRKDPKADAFHSKSDDYYTVVVDVLPSCFNRHTCDYKESKRSKRQSPDKKSADVYARGPDRHLRGTDRHPLGHENYPTEHNSFVRCFECFMSGPQGPTRAEYDKKKKVSDRDVQKCKEKVEVFRALIKPVMAKLSMNLPVDPNIPSLSPNVPKPGKYAKWRSVDRFRDAIRPLATEHGIQVRTPTFSPTETGSVQKRYEWHPTSFEKDKQRGIKDDSKIKIDKAPRKAKDMSDFRKTEEALQMMEEMDPTGESRRTRRQVADGKGMLTFKEVIQCLVAQRNVGVSPRKIRDAMCREAVKMYFEEYENENFDKVNKTIVAGCLVTKRYSRFLRYVKVAHELINAKAASKSYRTSYCKILEDSRNLGIPPYLTEVFKDWNMWFNEVLNYCVICIIVGRKTLLSYYESLESFYVAKFQWVKLRHRFLYDERNLYRVETPKKLKSSSKYR